MFSLSYRGIVICALAVSLSVSVAAGGGMVKKWIAASSTQTAYITPEPYNTLGLYDMNGDGVNEMIVHKTVVGNGIQGDSVYVYNPITGQVEWSMVIDSCYAGIVYPYSCFIDIDNDGTKEFFTWSVPPVSNGRCTALFINMTAKTIKYRINNSAPVPSSWLEQDFATAFLSDRAWYADNSGNKVFVCYDSSGNLAVYGFSSTGVNPSSPQSLSRQSIPKLSSFPNPFRSSSRIDYSLPTPGRVSLTIFDSQGKIVRSLANGDIQNAGGHSVVWDGKADNGQSMSSGVYYYKLIAGKDVVLDKQMIMLK